MLKFKEYTHTFFTILISTIVALVFCEIVLRVKHHFIPHYDIEMGKYAKTLKIKVSNEKINHIHKPGPPPDLSSVFFAQRSW